jgi:CheY-like chemotaxis protein
MNKKRIMIVEDESVTARSLEMSLVKLGYDVTAIMSSGEQAIQQLENGECPVSRGKGTRFCFTIPTAQSN